MGAGRGGMGMPPPTAPFGGDAGGGAELRRVGLPMGQQPGLEAGTNLMALTQVGGRNARAHMTHSCDPSLLASPRPPVLRCSLSHSPTRSIAHLARMCCAAHSPARSLASRAWCRRAAQSRWRSPSSPAVLSECSEGSCSTRSHPCRPGLSRLASPHRRRSCSGSSFA